MYCTSCGAEQSDGRGFCTRCGAELRRSEELPAAQLAAPARSRTRLLWALVLAVGALALFGACALLFNLPARVGLVPSEGERLLSGTPDREAADALETELTEQGFDMTGVDVWVLPVSGTDSSLGFVVLDESQGFTLDNYTLSDPVTDSLVALAQSGALQEAGVGQVGLEYRDEEGDSLGTLTVPMDSVTAVANGDITREEFSRAVEGRVDLLAALEVLQ